MTLTAEWPPFYLYLPVKIEIKQILWKLKTEKPNLKLKDNSAHFKIN